MGIQVCLNEGSHPVLWEIKYSSETLGEFWHKPSSGDGNASLSSSLRINISENTLHTYIVDIQKSFSPELLG